MNIIKRLLHKKTIPVIPEPMYNITGIGNKLIVEGHEVFSKINGLDINISGNNNIIYIDDADNFSNVNIYINSNNARLHFGKKYENIKSLNNIYIYIRNGNAQHLKIGDRTLIWGAEIFMDEEKSGLVIGSDCLFSDHIIIWTADGHPIFDRDTNMHLNTVKNAVRIGDNCWIGQGARITKNAQIANGCVIGAGTVLCKSFKQSNIAIAGNPSRVIKENIYWKHY